MISAGKKNIISIRYGPHIVRRVMAGQVLIWCVDEPFIHVTPNVVWLFSNINQADSSVLSNTSWSARVDS